jgi:hypothetical protein
MTIKQVPKNKTRAERREELEFKQRFAPKGATLADELKTIKSVKAYEKKSTKKKPIHISIRTK